MAFTFIESFSGTAGNNGTVTFGATPSDGELLVFAFSGVAAGATITPDISMTEVFQQVASFHNHAVFYRIASSEASASYPFTCDTGNNGTRFFGWRFSCDGAPTLADFVTGPNTAGTSVSDSIAAAAGNAVVAPLYTTNLGTKSWNSGWSQQLSAGRNTANYKISSGATETATVTYDNETSSSSHNLSILVFTDTPAGPAITSSPATLEPGESFQIVIDTPVTFDGVTLGGVAQTVSNSNTDGGVTTINCVCVQGNLKFNEHTLAVTNVVEI